jgi:hypothetical protein
MRLRIEVRDTRPVHLLSFGTFRLSREFLRISTISKLISITSFCLHGSCGENAEIFWDLHISWENVQVYPEILRNISSR